MNVIPTIGVPNQLCEACVVTKRTWKSYPNQAKFKVKERLKLIHRDFCGPISPPTPTRNTYFMLLVDDSTRFMWIYMLTNKDDALDVFKTFRARVEVETGTKLKNTMQ